MGRNNDPFKMVTEYQTAWLQAWSSGAQHVFDIWKRLIDLQQQMLDKAMTHSSHRSHVEIADGASFTDKYGKRAHDIDPEHDV